MKRLFGFDRLSTSDNFYGRTIPRRLSKEESWLFSFGTMTTNDRVGEFGVIRLSRLAGWKWFAERENILFYLLRLTFRSCGLKVHLDSEKEKRNKRISPTTRKKRKPVSGLSGERFTGKFFRLFIWVFWQTFRERDKEFTKHVLKHSFWECES